MKRKVYATFLSVFILLGVSIKGISQEQKKVGTLFLTGKAVNENKRGLECTILIFKNKKLISEFSTNRIGKFTYDMPMQDSIAIVIYAEGYVSKTLLVTTKIHPAKQNKDHMFPFFIDLYPVGRVPSHIDLDRPVGKIKYQGGQFIYDIDFTEEANDELKEFVKERKKMKVRQLEEDD